MGNAYSKEWERGYPLMGYYQRMETTCCFLAWEVVIVKLLSKQSQVDTKHSTNYLLFTFIDKFLFLKMYPGTVWAQIKNKSKNIHVKNEPYTSWFLCFCLEEPDDVHYSFIL